jgi:AraC-like DNA-binding protein
MNYIKGHYTEKITVHQLAEQVHWSDSTLFALFKEAFGKAPIAWLNDYRLSVATKLLKSTPDSIESIAQSVGIEDPRYFSKLFRRRYQCTPGQYRKNTLL